MKKLFALMTVVAASAVMVMGVGRASASFTYPTYCVGGSNVIPTTFVMNSKLAGALAGGVIDADAGNTTFNSEEDGSAEVTTGGVGVEETATPFDKTVTLGACTAGSAGSSYVAPPSGGFLCYAVGGQPFAFADDASGRALYMAGYWLPEAVAGNVADGENLGSYHLDCDNAANASSFGNTAKTSMYVDGNGNLLPAWYVTGSITDGLGTYPLAGS
jgi:hypothetical protein